jgi:hypothetical protein
MRNPVWVRFLAYTTVLECVLIKFCPPRSPLIAYWSIFGGLLLLHLVCSIWFILKVMPLASVHFIAYGPFEGALLYFLLDRGIQFVGTDAGAHLEQT